MPTAPADVTSHVVAGKLTPPTLSPNMIVRPRVASMFPASALVTLVVAPLGFGKTVAVKQSLASSDGQVAWVSIDLLDHDAQTFWLHVVTAITETGPTFDSEPLLLLRERGPRDPTFLGALLDQLAKVSDGVTLVLDGLDKPLERTTFEQLGLLVERARGAFRLVIATRADHGFPLARWRSLGWVADVDAAALEFTDDEAIDLAIRCGVDRDPGDVRALNERVGRWPLAFHLAIVSHSIDDGPSPQVIASGIVNDVLNSLPDAERELTMALCVLDRFDPEFCAEFVGPHAAPLLQALLRRGVLLEVSDPATDTMRFHGYFRTLLEAELRRQDPARRIDLHKRAVPLWRERGDLLSAFHHLDAIGETERAHSLFVDPAMAYVEAGDRAGLRRFARRLPAPHTVGSARLAVELSVVALFSDGSAAAAAWCDRADALLHGSGVDGADGELASDLRGLRCAIALLEADLDSAVAAIGDIESLGAPGGHVGQWFPILAARVLLGARRLDEARFWIAQAERLPSSGILRNVTIPTLRAWLDWAVGDLRTAERIIDAALRWMDEHDVGTHHLAFDTLITAGWIRLSRGDVAGTERLIERARRDAEVLGSAWNHLQAAFLAARYSVLIGETAQALRVIDDAKSLVSFDRCRAYTDRILGVEIEAFIASGRLAEAETMTAALHPGPRRQLLSARVNRTDTHRRPIEETLHGWGDFPIVERFQAELLIAVADPGSGAVSRVARVVERCHDAGWALPLVGMGSRADRLIGSLDLARIHPELDELLTHLRSRRSRVEDRPHPVEFTGRERTLLELLPTHLSYTEMGDRLFLSVNTVKSNLRSIYRKLGASTRAEAVDIAIGLGLL